MFRHKGKNRTFSHNLRLASILSFVAGIVNITGVLTVKTLTTNVTGHFAFFSEQMMHSNYEIAIVFIIFIFAFLAGSFVSNTLIEIVLRKKPEIAYILPMIIEIIILTFIGFLKTPVVLSNADGHPIAYALLFAMGLQNSLVTKVSQSVVRTTHLTGLFTDLGIELSQLFFYRQAIELQQLKKGISLKLAIIAGFFLGCLFGGYVCKTYELKALLLASASLILALFYDNILFRFYYIKRKIQSW